MAIDVAHTAASHPVSATLRTAGLVLGSLLLLAQLGRAFLRVDDAGVWPWYAGLGAAYLALYALALLRPPARAWQSHALLALQSLLVVGLLLVEPEQDFMTGLFGPLAFEAALLFGNRVLWCWVGVLAALTAGPLMLMFPMGAAQGLSRALATIAAEIVFAAYVVVAGQVESARRQSQTMLEELQSAHARLQAYAAQAGELAAVCERDRVARELNDSVAETVSGVLAAAQAARDVLAAEDDAAAARDHALARARPQAAARLAAIQADTQHALAQMRRLVAELRPRGDRPAEADR